MKKNTLFSITMAARFGLASLALLALSYNFHEWWPVIPEMSPLQAFATVALLHLLIENMRDLLRYKSPDARDRES